MYIGWALVVLGVILLPPMIAIRINRRRTAAAEAGPTDPGA
jgi:hypothetical protein